MARGALLLFAAALIMLTRSCRAGESARDNATTAAQITQGEKCLSTKIEALLKHYQQADPVGLPEPPLPDPMELPDMQQSFSLYTLKMTNIMLYGQSKFRIEHVHSELAKMQVSVAVNIDKVDVKGLYTLSSWLSRSAGDFTVNCTGVTVMGLSRLEVGDDGKLHAQDIELDMTADNIFVDFKNLGFFVSIFQNFVNSVGSFVFDTMKPYLLQQIKSIVRDQVNEKIASLPLPKYFPNSISPFDMVVAKARKEVSDMGYDPFKVKDYSQSMGMFTVTSSHTWLTGLASFYRMGNITLTMENGIVYAVIDLGTQELEGRTHWEVSLIEGVLSRAGTVSFTVEYFRVQLNLSQPLDTRKRATLEEIDFELGNIQTRIHGAGTIDYLVEAGVNILPNLLRNQIMDALEGPIRRRIQDELDKVDVEKLIHDKIPDIQESAMMLERSEPEDDIVLEMTPPPEPDNLEPFSESEEERGQS